MRVIYVLSRSWSESDAYMQRVNEEPGRARLLLKPTTSVAVIPDGSEVRITGWAGGHWYAFAEAELRRKGCRWSDAI